MSAPCHKCGAARSCQHRDVEPPRLVPLSEQPKSGRPGKRVAVTKYAQRRTLQARNALAQLERGTHFTATREAYRGA